MLRRADNGLWQSVTGSSHPGEAIEDTAVRELQEETGLTLAAGKMTSTGRIHRYEIIEPWRARYAPDITHNTEHVFDFQIQEDQNMDSLIRIQPAEHTEFRWVSGRAAAELVFSRTNRMEIERVLSYLALDNVR